MNFSTVKLSKNMTGILEKLLGTDGSTSSGKCPDLPSQIIGSGNLDISFNQPYPSFQKKFSQDSSWPPSFDSLSKVYKQYTIENSAGIFHPSLYEKPYQCDKPDADSTISIIICFRNRAHQLKIYLTYMIPFLMRQGISFKIYVIEQAGIGTFNRAKLFNAGFDLIETDNNKNNNPENLFNPGCYFFSDVDLIPENNKNSFKCDPNKNPKHYTAYIDKWNYKLLYKDIFGGITQIPPEKFKYVNGYSNKYWGWGAEDDDMYRRLFKFGKFELSRSDPILGRMKMISHKREKSNSVNEKRRLLLNGWRRRMLKDGLSDLKYKVVRREDFGVFEKIIVDIGTPWSDPK